MPIDDFPRHLDSSAVLNLVNDEDLHLFVACKVTMPDENGDDEIHRLWTGYGDLTIDLDPGLAGYAHAEHNQVYSGVGDLLAVSEISENSDLAARGITLTLVSTADNEFLTTFRDRQYQSKPVEVFIGMLDPDTGSTRGLMNMFSGFADQMIFSQQPNQILLTLTAESRLIRLSKSSNRYLTKEDQAMEFPDDRGLDFVYDLKEKKVLWGRT
jgi:hypothetical protein